MGYAVLVGLIAGLLRAAGRRHSFGLPTLQSIWLVYVALLPQTALFFASPLREQAPDWSAAVVLVASQLLLLLFAWHNRRHAAFWLLGAGLFLNFLVIVLNGGLMPISPQTVQAVRPDISIDTYQLYQRLGTTKDVLLPAEEIWLPWLSDRFVSPQAFPQRFAYSVGDVIIGLGALIFLWQAGGRYPESSALATNSSGATP